MHDTLDFCNAAPVCISAFMESPGSGGDSRGRNLSNNQKTEKVISFQLIYGIPILANLFDFIVIYKLGKNQSRAIVLISLEISHFETECFGNFTMMQTVLQMLAKKIPDRLFDDFYPSLGLGVRCEHCCLSLGADRR
jgi:hypothetical protein